MLDALKEQWAAAVNAFREQLGALNVARSRLIQNESIARQDPDDYAEWQSLMGKLDTIQSVVDGWNSTIAAVSSAWGTFTDTFGLSGWRRKGIARVLTGKRLSGLGILPIIPIGALIAFVAALSALVISIVRFVDYLEVKENNKYSNDLTQQGEDARAQILAAGGSIEAANAEAALVVNREATRRAKEQTGFAGTLDQVKSILIWTFAGFVAIQILPVALKRLGRVR